MPPLERTEVPRLTASASTPPNGICSEGVAWSDDEPSDTQQETRRHRTKRHSVTSRSGRSSVMPGGQTVPYERYIPRRENNNPFSLPQDPGSRHYGEYRNETSSYQAPFGSGQRWTPPEGGYHGGDHNYYTTGQYGADHAASPFPQNPFSPGPPLGQPAYEYMSSYPSPPPRPLSSSFNDGRTGVRGPLLRVRSRQREDAQDDREADRQRSREHIHQKAKEAEKAERRREREKKKEREKKEREKMELDRKQLELIEQLQQQVQNLQKQQQLGNERNKGLDRVDHSPGWLDVIERLQLRRDQEDQQRMLDRILGRDQEDQQRMHDRMLGRDADTLARLLRNLAGSVEARATSAYLQDEFRWPGRHFPISRPPTRSDWGDQSFDGGSSLTRQIEKVVEDYLTRLAKPNEAETSRPSLLTVSQPPPPGSSEGPLTDDEYYRLSNQGRRQTRHREDDPSSAAPRSADAPRNVDDAYRSSSSPEKRASEFPRDINNAYPSPESVRYGQTTRGHTSPHPGLGRRQTTASVQIKVASSGSGKRAYRSDRSSEYSQTLDHESQPREPWPRQEAPPRDPQRAGSNASSGGMGQQTSARPALSPRHRHRSRSGVRHSVSLHDQDPAGGRPIMSDDEEDYTSGEDTRGPHRKTRPYSFSGEKVHGGRYNAREAAKAANPPLAPEAPVAAGKERPRTPSTGTQRSQRPAARVDSWSDIDEQEEMRHRARSETRSTMR